MNIPIEDLEKIDAYFKEELSNLEKEVIKNRMQSDNAFKENTNAYKIAMQSIRIQALKTELTTIHNQYQNKKPTVKRINTVQYLAVAASFAIFVIIGLSVFFYNSAPSAQELFVQHFEPYPNLVSVRGESESSFQKGMQLYSNEKYEEAITVFSKLDDNTVVSFYLGVSYLATNQLELATTTLQKSLQTNQPYKEQTRWYLALSYLKSNNLLQAREQLRSIQQSEYHYKEASNILKEIE